MPALTGGHFFSGRFEMADLSNQPDIPSIPPTPGKTEPIPPEMPPNEVPVPEDQPTPTPHPAGPGPVA
jgi:hypothetical protein